MKNRILIADDEALSRKLLQTLLQKMGFEVVVTRDGAEAWRELEKADAPSLAVLDWMMPGCEGIELVRRIRAQKERAYTYVILLTARREREDLLEGLNAGADDYLRKPLDADELQAKIVIGKRILAVQQRLAEALDAERYQARHDSLTGLYNHREILNMLEREIERNRRQNCCTAAIMLDVDHFKQINDTYGHQCGDAVLREFSRRVVSILRPYDSCGRYGGEEFLVVVPQCDLVSARHIAERIRVALSEEPVQCEGQSISVTASVGVTASCNGKRTADAMVQACDQAMYASKRSGRNRVSVFDELAANFSDQAEVSAVR
jgi:two-component system, cell cycle response regulator